jgi:dihydrofolate synthase/folylpolyglutamate synthase
MMSLLCPVVDCTVLTSPASAPANRVWDADRALDFGRSNGWQVQLVRDLPAAVSHASEIARTVVITGSFHTVGEASLVLTAD